MCVIHAAAAILVRRAGCHLAAGPATTMELAFKSKSFFLYITSKTLNTFISIFLSSVAGKSNTNKKIYIFKILG